MELKPCPFCGGDELSHGCVDYGTHSFGNVECHSCDAVVTADTEDEAINKWNTRADAAEIAKLRKDLAEAVRHLKNAEKRLTVHPDEKGDATQLEINCAKGLAHVRRALDCIKGE